MLFVALTRSALELSPHSAREFSIAPGWFLTVVTDGFLSRVSVSAQEIAAAESLSSDPENRDLGVAFVTARFLRARQTLQVSKSPGSGRPVYYSVNSKGEFFLSTHIVLLGRAGVRIEEDPDVMGELLAYRAVAPPRTLYRGIRQLWLAGDIAVQVQGENLQITLPTVGYLPSESSAEELPADAALRVANLLQASVDTLLPLASRVATLLSGGVDSSILTAITRDRLSALDTCSTSYPFDGPATNFEQQYALSAASALGTRHTLFAPTATDYLTGFIEALAAAEAPLDHLQSVLLHLLFKGGVPGGLDLIVCGEAADSAFGLGIQYLLSRPPGLRSRVCSLPPMRAALNALGSYWARAQGLSELMAQIDGLRRSVSDPGNPIWSYSAYGDFEWIRTHYGASREDVIGPRCSHFQQSGSWSFNDALSIYALNFDVTITTSIWSKLAEGQQKILYLPFANGDVLDAAFSIPWNVKLQTEKHVIRGAGMKLGVPPHILNRPKQSFGIMSDQWAVKGGAFEPLVRVAAKVVDIGQLRSLQGTDPRKAMTFWTLLNYAVLKRLFVLGEDKQTLIDEVLDNCDRQRYKQEDVSGRLPQAVG
jgi:asparagine synthetase B (glutamine-hydrolysing)